MLKITEWFVVTYAENLPLFLSTPEKCCKITENFDFFVISLIGEERREFGMRVFQNG